MRSIEVRDPAALTPSPHNAREHSPENVDQLASSISTWGFTIPILVDEEDTILAGHGRALAAIELGLEEVPVLVAVDWSEEEKRAYTLADNRLALCSDWDLNLLADELANLQAVGFDLSLAGFEPEDLEALQEALDDQLEQEQENEDQGEPDDEPEEEADLVSFGVTIRRDQLRTLNEAIDHAKDRLGVGTVGEALFAIAFESLKKERSLEKRMEKTGRPQELDWRPATGED